MTEAQALAVTYSSTSFFCRPELLIHPFHTEHRWYATRRMKNVHRLLPVTMRDPSELAGLFTVTVGKCLRALLVIHPVAWAR